MSDDVCGHPTADGTPCQHPTTDDGDADRCWISAHNDAPTESGDPGREFTIDESDHEAILEAAELGTSKAGCARAAGAGIDALRRYLEARPEFREDFARARARGEQRLLRGPLMQDDEAREQMDGQHARFLLSTSFDYVKTEKRELENTGDKPLGNVVVDFTDVDT